MKELDQKLSKIMTMLTQINIAKKSVLTLNEACKYTGLSKSKLYKMSSNREISVSKPEGKLFFKREDLDVYMLSNYIISKEKLSNDVGSYFNRRRNDY